MKSFLRGIVSQEKRRFREHGFDLDLSYITPRIIAMAFPSSGLEAFYRHSKSEIMDFLTKYHQDSFKIFNLCSEKDYDPDELGGNVERFPFEDHNPAPLSTVMGFCKSAGVWLSLNPENVIVVHCKAGKGRTGLMICSYLLYANYFPTPDSAFLFYAEKRTKNGKGLTIPSQIRYVQYFKNVLDSGDRPLQELLVSRIRIREYDGDPVHFRISSNQTTGNHEVVSVLSSTEEGYVISSQREAGYVIYELNRTWITGDIKVDVFKLKTKKEHRLFYFWFNASYVDGNKFCLLSKKDFDKPCKSIPQDVQVHLIFLEKVTRQHKLDDLCGF